MNLSKPIMNPITVIALFAGLSEASATTVLPYLDDNTRQLYVGFLIAFPSTLVILFFLTLNFNPKALYPPTETTRLSTHDQSEITQQPDSENSTLSCDTRLHPEDLQKSSKLVGSHDS